MDANLTLWWTVFLIAAVLDVVLWTAAFLSRVGPDGRFRLFAAAAFLLFVVLGLILNWGIAAGISFVALWIYAVIAGTAKGSQEARS